MSGNKAQEYMEMGKAKLGSQYFDQAIQYFDKANKENLSGKEREQLIELYSKVFLEKAESLRIGIPTDKYEDTLLKKGDAIQFYEKCLRITNNENWFYKSVLGIAQAHLYIQPKLSLVLEYLKLAQKFSNLEQQFPWQKKTNRISEIKRLKDYCISKMNASEENKVTDDSEKKKLILYNALSDKIIAKLHKNKNEMPVEDIESLANVDLVKENTSKVEQNLSDNFNEKPPEISLNDKDTEFINTTNTQKDVDGWVSIKHYRHGLYMKEIPPIGNGKPPNVQNVLNRLTMRGINLPPESTIQSFLLSKSNEYVRIGDSKLKPFAEANVKVKISEIDEKVYVTLLPPKLGGRDLEVADVVYELRKKMDVYYKVNEEKIREALELEKYNEPIVIVKEDTSLSNTSLDDPFAELEEVNEPRQNKTQPPEETEKEKITNAIANTQNFIKAGNFQNALISINEEIELGLKLPVTYYNRGYIQFQLKNWDGAIQDYSEAIRLNPIDAEYYNARGRTLFELEKLQEAIQDFSKAIQIDPEIEMTYLNRGICYSLEKEFDKALKDFLEYEKRNTNDPMLYFERANIKVEREDIYGAIQDFDQFLRLKPNDPDVMYRKALLLFESSEYDRALEICDKILLSQPNWETAKELRGLLRSKKGDLMGAIHDFGY